jgi:hypothetical protein
MKCLIKLVNVQFSVASRSFFPLKSDILLSKLSDVRNRNQAMTSKGTADCECFHCAIAIYKVFKTVATL